jgi:hypothetical protein
MCTSSTTTHATGRHSGTSTPAGGYSRGVSLMKNKLRRLERAARGNLESFELRDSSHCWYEPMETAKELFLHSVDCLRANSLEDWPEVPEFSVKVCEAKDPATVLERLVPSGREAWFIELPYDREVLISERRLEPVHHGPVPGLSFMAYCATARSRIRSSFATSCGWRSSG